MEEVGVTIGYLQDSIKRKDYHPELIKEYFLQRSEEAGEGTCTGNLKRLSSRRVRKGNSRRRIVGLIIMFFLLPTVIDLETVILQKEAVNRLKYPTDVVFDPSVISRFS